MDRDAADLGIGDRVRMVRKAKGLSIRTLADLAGVSKSDLGRWEVGDRVLDRLSDVDRLADALGVSRAYLLGLPAEVTDPQRAEVHFYTDRIRRALLDTELGERPEMPGPPRPLRSLVEHAHSAQRVRVAGGAQAAAARMIPDIIVELHAWFVDGDEREQLEAARGLVVACSVASGALKWTGFTDLAWLASARARDAARHLSDPVWQGFAAFHAAHTVAPYARALANSVNAANQLQPHVGEDRQAQQVYGMLHLMAAFSSAASSTSGDSSQAHLREARDLAERTGETTDFELYFGPANVAVWQVSTAVEQGAGGRAAEIARKIDSRAIPSAMRQATFYVDLGRGFCQERRDREALNAFLSAERIAPEIVHSNAMVRNAVGHILQREVRAAGGPQLRGFARRVGVLPAAMR